MSQSYTDTWDKWLIVTVHDAEAVLTLLARMVRLQCTKLTFDKYVEALIARMIDLHAQLIEEIIAQIAHTLSR